MNAQSRILSLPQNARYRIYALALASRVELEVDKQGDVLTRFCVLLRISRYMRDDVFEACRQSVLQLVHTFQSPAAMGSTNFVTHPIARLPIKTIRIALLAEIDNGTARLTESEERGSDRGPNVAPLFKAWREAFRALPMGNTIELAYFDLIRTFRMNLGGIARLINNISAILQHRSRNRARCRIIGCKTNEGQSLVEQSTVNVDASANSRGRRSALDAEYQAGPSRIQRERSPGERPLDVEQKPVHPQRVV